MSSEESDFYACAMEKMKESGFYESIQKVIQAELMRMLIHEKEQVNSVCDEENKAKLNDVDRFVRTKCGRLYFDVFCDFLLRFKLFNTTKTLLAELGLNQESSLLGEKKYECYNLPGIFASESGMDLLNTISRSSASNDVHQNSCMDSHCNIGSQFVNSLFPSCSVKRMPQGMCAIRNGESRTSKTERRNFDEIYSKLEGLGKIPPSRSSANVPPEEQIAVDESAPSTASSRPKGEGFSFPELKGKVQPEKGNANLAIDHLLKKLSINEADSDTVEEYGKASDDSIAKDLEFDKSVYSDNSDDQFIPVKNTTLVAAYYDFDASLSRLTISRFLKFESNATHRARS
ncbi:Polycystin-1 [Trichinella pseudospiralis]